MKTGSKNIFAWQDLSGYALFLLVLFLGYELFISNIAFLRVVSKIFIGGYIDKAVSLLLFLATVLFLASHFDQIRLDHLAFLMCFAVLFAAAYGLLDSPSLRYYFSHLTAAALMIIYYLVGYSSSWRIKTINQAIAVFSHAVVLLYSVMIAAFWVMYYSGEARYLGFSCQYLLLPLAYYLSRKKYALALLTGVLIMLSAKRGVYLGAGAILFFYAVRRVKSLVTVLLILAGAGVLSVSLLIFASEFIAGLPVIGTVASKLDLLLKMDDMAQLSIATSGRSTELLAALFLLLEDWKNLIFGMGYGWHFSWSSIYHPEYIIKSNYVHISFVNYILQYGLIMGGMLILFIVERPLAMFKTLRQRLLPPEMWWLPLFIIGKLITAQTAYSLARDVIFWILLGVASRLVVETKQVCRIDCSEAACAVGE